MGTTLTLSQLQLLKETTQERERVNPLFPIPVVHIGPFYGVRVKLHILSSSPSTKEAPSVVCSYVLYTFTLVQSSLQFVSCA